jgi:calcium/calmodulin-dependent protein kinase I
VHRDLKPENLLYVNVEDNALIKVSDFGLARFMATKETLYTACGTPNYVAPEVIAGHGYDALVDCWSLGVILYVMLCGFPPFYDEEEEALFQQIKNGHFEFPSPYWDNVSENAKDLIKNLLILDPSHRLTAEQILKHQWLSETNDNVQQLQFQVNEYKKFKTYRLVIYDNFRNMLLWLQL